MIFDHEGITPEISASAWVAPGATVCGAVRLGHGTRILHGAQIVAEAGGSIEIGRNCIVLENAVVRATARHNCHVGDHCLIGPHSHVVGCRIEDEVFIATGASVFHGATVGKGSELRINSIVHIKTRLPANSIIPIAWIAVGEPLQILPPDRHDEIWAFQQPLDFPEWVYGMDRKNQTLMIDLTRALSEQFARHAADTQIG